ncbi:hypothetical protein [Chitinophaga barathri]|uniref:Uncharacterized protein n=1 Tax=Chitinophaga barathri TaxID=1647451 RepID=A0A3N4N4T5_9BACT|nr:hypothetical protein [Chitinophaga barathri]RPD42633.1 hypothetical protein EG028_05560 [Chitinophaga barathri]
MIRVVLLFILVLQCSCTGLNEWRERKQKATWERRVAEFERGQQQYVILPGLTGYIYRPEEVEERVGEDETRKIALSLADVLETEKYMREQMVRIDTPRTFSSPHVHQKLSGYGRQYVGYMNVAGERIVWVNAIWGGFPLHRGIESVKDGGDYYWNVKVNLTRKKVYDLYINGEA